MAANAGGCAARKRSFHIGSPAKAVIDLNASTFNPVLQNTAFAALLQTPAEDFATLLEATKRQRVDVTALVVGVGPERQHTTSHGEAHRCGREIRDAS